MIYDQVTIRPSSDGLKCIVVREVMAFFLGQKLR